MGAGNHHSTTRATPPIPQSLSHKIYLFLPCSLSRRGFQLLRFPFPAISSLQISLSSPQPATHKDHYPGFLFCSTQHQQPPSLVQLQWQAFFVQLLVFPPSAALSPKILPILAHSLETQDLKQEIWFGNICDFVKSFPFSKFSGTLSIAGVLR